MQDWSEQIQASGPPPHGGKVSTSMGGNKSKAVQV